MVTLVLENDIFGEAFLLKTAVKVAIKKYREDVRLAKKALKEDPNKNNHHIYQNAIDDTERLMLTPLAKLYHKKIKTITL